jgi:hypothetical protein
MKSCTCYVDREILARDLHETARQAVLEGKTVAHTVGNEKTFTFIEWDDLAEPAKEGRRMQADQLIAKYRIMYRFGNEHPSEKLEH